MESQRTGRISSVGIALAAYAPEVSVFASQLKSLQEQTWSAWICVVTSDSPLEAVLMAPEMAPFRGDSRFIWVENAERLGHKKNFEKAIQLVLDRGVDAIACSDQDDVWYPEKLAESVAALERTEPLSLVHCDMHVLREGVIAPGTAWEIESRGIANAAPRHMFVRNIVAGCAMLFDAELARRYPVIPPEAEYHDHWYAVVAAHHGGIHAIARPLYAYRQHGANQVGVSPFAGRFALREKMGISTIVKKCRSGFRKSHDLAQAAIREGLPVRGLSRVLFVGRADLGFGILAMGLANFWSDPPLARACIARAMGKLADTLWPAGAPGGRG